MEKVEKNQKKNGKKSIKNTKKKTKMENFKKIGARKGVIINFFREKSRENLKKCIKKIKMSVKK